MILLAHRNCPGSVIRPERWVNESILRVSLCTRQINGKMVGIWSCCAYEVSYNRLMQSDGLCTEKGRKEAS